MANATTEFFEELSKRGHEPLLGTTTGSVRFDLVDGKKTVRILGEEIPVRASIHTMGGLSGHAGQTDLLRWFDSLASSRPRVILTHGEDRARDALKRTIADRHGIEAECPSLYDVIEF